MLLKNYSHKLRKCKRKNEMIPHAVNVANAKTVKQSASSSLNHDLNSMNYQVTSGHETLKSKDSAEKLQNNISKKKELEVK